MKATCNREELQAAFQVVAGVVPTRSPKPILLNVKLVADADGATLLATDLEVGVRCKVSGIEVHTPGEVVLPTKQFGGILRESTDPTLQISVKDSKVQIRGARSSFQLPTEDVREFPEVGGFDCKAYHTVKSDVLRKMIRRTIFATEVDNSRYALNGVLVEAEGNKISFIATDGRRLAVMRGSGSATGEHSTRDLTPVVPKVAMQLLERNLGDDDEDVQIAIESNKALMRTPRAIVSSRLVEGRFPRYQDVFPSRFSAQVPLNVRDALQAVRQAAIVTDEESRGVDWSLEEGKLVLSASAAEVGESEVELPITYDGEAVRITFDPRYVMEMLRTLEEESTVSLELVDGKSAAVFKTDDGYSYVVMPLMRER